jgi:hypothetical protein
MRQQHGDIIFVRVKAIPIGAKQIKIYPGFVVEKGEGVNQHTLLQTGGVSGYEKDGVLYLKVTEQCDLLTHSEHGVQTYRPGIYRKESELEYDAEADETRKTID